MSNNVHARRTVARTKRETLQEWASTERRARYTNRGEVLWLLDFYLEAMQPWYRRAWRRLVRRWRGRMEVPVPPREGV